MANGYTHCVLDGGTLEAYFRKCCEAFFCSARDAAPGTTLEHLLYTEEASAARRLQSELDSLRFVQGRLEDERKRTDADWQAAYDKAMEEHCQFLNAGVVKDGSRAAKYDNMMQKVTEVEFPDLLSKIRGFMLEQLGLAKRFDCEAIQPKIVTLDELKFKTPLEKWRRDQEEASAKAVAIAHGHYEEARVRYTERMEFIDAIRAQLEKFKEL